MLRALRLLGLRLLRLRSLGLRSLGIRVCVLINRDAGDASGAGETSVTVAAAAIGNAVFDATGVRLRQVPC